ncbi:MAG: hypothetical protein Q9178_001002 [Gyalolechia marmorata]
MGDKDNFYQYVQAKAIVTATSRLKNVFKPVAQSQRKLAALQQALSLQMSATHCALTQAQITPAVESCSPTAAVVSSNALSHSGVSQSRIYAGA